MLFSLTSCSGVKVDDPVTMNGLHTSPEYVCRGFVQSIFTNDEEMFYECFYDGEVIKEENDLFAEYQKMTNDGYVFLGNKFVDIRPCQSEFGYDYDNMKDNISVFNGVDESKIDDIQQVDIKTFFENDGHNESVEFYSIVYKAEGKWYFFSLMDVTGQKSK